MIALVCGGRDYDAALAMHAFLDAFHAETPISLLVQGDARGADRMAATWAASRGVHYAAVPALWNRYGNAAGPRRNAAMLLLRPEVVIAFPGGSGTADMVKQAKAAGVPVLEVSRG